MAEYWDKVDPENPGKDSVIDVTKESKAATVKKDVVEKVDMSKEKDKKVVPFAKPPKKSHTTEEIDRNKEILLALGFYKKQNGGEKVQFITKEGNVTVGRTFSHDYPIGKFWGMHEGDLPSAEKFLKDAEVKQLKIVQAFYDVRDKGGDIKKYMPVDPRYTPQTKTQAPAQKQEVAIPVQQTVAVAQAPNEVIQEAEVMATALYNVVEKQQLYTKIGDKKHLQLEAWQLLAKFCNVHGFVETVVPVTYFGVKGFESRAVIKDAEGNVIAVAEAACMTDETFWKDKPLFQLKSMSQTRALSKAYRSCLSFIVSIAGYSPTPLEEMEAVR